MSQSRSPFYTGQKADDHDYIGSLNDALFSGPVTFAPVASGVTGSAQGTIVATGRHLDVSITVTGPSVSSSGTLRIPARPSMNLPFRAVTIAEPPVFLGDCPLDSAGVLKLPDWNTSDSVVIFGQVVEA